MAISRFQKFTRKIKKRAASLAMVTRLTLSGNTIVKESKLDDAQNPVMLIYGFGATRRTLEILEKRLRQDGHVIFSIRLGGFFGTFNTHSIEDLAMYVQEKIERLYKKYHFQGPLTIIGYSKGGLIGHYYLKKLGGETRVKKLITLGTPHQGSPWALLGALTPLRWVLASLKQMSPGSLFLSDLKEIPFPQKTRIYSIYSTSDKVCPYPTSVLTENSNVKNFELKGLSHSELLVRKKVYDAIQIAMAE